MPTAIMPKLASGASMAPRAALGGAPLSMMPQARCWPLTAHDSGTLNSSLVGTPLHVRFSAIGVSVHVLALGSDQPTYWAKLPISCCAACGTISSVVIDAAGSVTGPPTTTSLPRCVHRPEVARSKPLVSWLNCCDEMTIRRATQPRSD